MDGEKEVKPVEVELTPVEEMVKKVLSFNDDASPLKETTNEPE